MFSKPIPLERYNRVSSSCVEEVRRVIGHSYCPHDLELARINHSIKAHYNSFQLCGVSLNFLSYGADIEITPKVFQGFYMLEFPLSGGVILEYGDAVYKTHTGLGTIISLHEPVRSQWSADCEQVMVKIDRRIVEQYVHQQTNISITKPLEFEPLIDLSSENGGLIKDFILMLLKQADKCPNLITEKHVSAELEQALLALILHNIDHNYSTQILGSDRLIMPKSVRRARSFIERAFAEPLALDDIVKAAGCSKRALYSAFKEFLGITPLNYLKNVRFQDVHERLQPAYTSDTVFKIAHQSGFTHMGRFSSEYLLRYGKKPSNTLRFS